MFVIKDMTQVSIYIAIATFFLLFFALRKNPLRTVAIFARELITNRKYVLHFTAVIAILYFNKIELSIERHMGPQPDFTPYIYKLEGNFVAYVQQFFQNSTLTVLSTFFYVVIFPCLMIASIGIYTGARNLKFFYALCYAIIFNYMVAIPFYLFFPVNEVWSFHPDVHFIMNSVFPAFEKQYRPLSGVDNCFPSLHTSISVSMAVIAYRSKNRFWRLFTMISAVFIIFSIFYLGIHWLTDMCGGLLLGLAASRIALRIAEGRAKVGSYADGVLNSRDMGK